ncbi:MAG: acyl-CoA mutase large subunit family protein [Candidatus Dormibacteria bacterium]
MVDRTDSGLQSAHEEWRRRAESGPRRPSLARTLGEIPLEPLYSPANARAVDYARDLGNPGEFPYTRGVYPSMYRGNLWTMRQFSGFGNAHQTNERYKFLLSQGQAGLSVAFDMPTLMGHDSDSPHSAGEVGRCGVAVDSLDDMETLFDGIDLAGITTSMTINSPAIILLAMYFSVAEKRGIPLEKLGGTIQNDILKEYIAQKEFIYPPRPSMRLVQDVMTFCTRNVPRWHTISISGYHIREAGSTAAQELAFTLSDGIEYVQAGIDAGMKVDEFAPRLSFFFNAHIDFFEEIAKYRAARRIWARVMRDRFGAQDPKSWLCRFHVQTAGCSLTAQQPENNVARTALEAMAAVLGGCNSLHTNSMDEVLALPTEKAAQVALRTQQIIAYETGVTEVADPLGGSWYVEELTDRMEEDALAYIDRIDQMGGALSALERGFQQQEIANAAYRHQQELESHERIFVGINGYGSSLPDDMEVLKIGTETEVEQVERVRALRERRDNGAVAAALAALADAARGTENTVPFVMRAVQALATEGEIIEALRPVFGTHRETPVF